ncbi:MAG: septum site-determining protein Ssd, partial [Nocardioidaceae bacterium]
VGVVGGCGGAGASTLASALAVSAARQRRPALLVDADPLGGGIDMVVGSEDARGLRWPDLAATHGRVSGDSLRQVLPRMSDLGVLSWDRGDLVSIPRESMRSVLSAGRRSHDAIIVDVPRRLDAAAEEALVCATCVLLVVPAEIRAIAAAQRVLAQIRPLCADVRLVVREPGPNRLGSEVVADTMALPLLASIRTDRRVSELIDDGLGPLARRRTPLAGTCSVILDGLGLLRAAVA